MGILSFLGSAIKPIAGLDTVAGHMWIWVESPAVDKRDGGRYLIYQGQLEPGREMGDIVSEQHWPAEKQ